MNVNVSDEYLPQASGNLSCDDARTECMAMSTIEEVRAAEKKVQEVLDALKKAGARDPNHLGAELQKATDEYARAVRELKSE